MKKYDSYKDSGIEWIGDIPNHWKKTKVKFEILPKGYKAGPFGSSLITSELTLSGTVKVFSPEHVAEKVIQEEWFLPEERLDEMSQFIVNDKDVVLPIVGTLGLARVFSVSIDGKGIINQRLAKISCNSKKILPDFFCVVMKDVSNYQEYFKLKARGSILSHLNKETIVSMPIGLPPIEEQELILSYLKDKTTQIDTLIAKKEQFSSLLQEERNGIINQLMTPKDNNWKAVPIRYLIMGEYLKQQDGNHGELHPVASEYMDDGIPFVMANHLKNGEIDLDNCKYISEERAKKLRIGFAEIGDVLLTHKGTLGRVAMVQKAIKTDFVMLTPQVTFYRCLRGIDNEFLKLIFESDKFQNQMKFIGGEGTTRAYVGLLAQRNIVIDFPVDMQEQKQIVSKIKELIKINTNLSLICEKEIELLKEYKTALISEVVTGKVDVRDEVLI